MAQPAVVAAEDLEHSNEYGDEGFESDVPRSRPSRDDRESSEKCVEESAVLGLDTGLDDADLQVHVVDAMKEWCMMCVHIICICGRSSRDYIVSPRVLVCAVGTNIKCTKALYYTVSVPAHPLVAP